MTTTTTNSSDIEKSLTIVQVDSVEDAISKLSTAVSAFNSNGVLVLRGAKLSLEDQILFTKKLGDIYYWNFSSHAPQSTIDTSIYQGGHSDNLEKEYNQNKDEYVLDWHIEQVYYVHPILAGVWNMETFTAPAGSGDTRFVDSIELYGLYSEEDRDFLAKSIVVWDKPAPHGKGPFYTKVVDAHPISGLPLLRVETDQGSYAMPKLHTYDGEPATQDQIDRLDGLLATLKDNLNNNKAIRYSQHWQQGDLLIVDLFRMYHSVMGGFSAGQRKFTGIGIRPKVYDNSMYTNPGGEGYE
jgi:alpha-ketoglutarate-dependent taurine dioxygenase